MNPSTSPFAAPSPSPSGVEGAGARAFLWIVAAPMLLLNLFGGMALVASDLPEAASMGPAMLGFGGAGAVWLLFLGLSMLWRAAPWGLVLFYVFTGASRLISA